MGPGRMILRVLKDCLIYWRTLLIVFVPIIFCPLPISFADSEHWKAMNCAYVVVIMAFYWIFEVVPLAVTAMIPVFLFPLLSVMSVGETCSPYLSASNFLFVGGLIIAIAIEEVNLHKRVALKVLLLMGSDPKWILFGFMMTTWFLSMWMSNTATCAMMLPIAMAVIRELVKYRSAERLRIGSGDVEMDELTTKMLPSDQKESVVDEYHEARESMSEKSPVIVKSKVGSPEKSAKAGAHNGAVGAVDVEDHETWHKEDQKLAKCILISLCYASSIGGCATLTGTVPNVITQGQLEKSNIPGVSYANWMGSQFPPSLVLILLTWPYMQLVFFPYRDIFSFRKKVKNEGFTKILQGQYDDLGDMQFGEFLVTFLYMILIALWIFRDPKFIDGYAEEFPKGYVKDAVPAMLIAFLLFFLPRDKPDFICFRQDKEADPVVRKPLMTWAAMKKFPWDVILLLGGGFAMAKGVTSSELSLILADVLRDSVAKSVSPEGFLAIVVIFITFFTDITSNASAANIFIPILIAVARAMGVHPIYFAIPVGIATSYAYMLPVSTPPNAIVFGAGIIKVTDMMIAGFGLNWISIAVQLFFATMYMPMLFDLSVNATAPAVPALANTTVP